MSEYDVRQVGKQENQYIAAEGSSNNRIATALSTGNVGNGQYVADNQGSTTIDIENRVKMIETIVAQHPGTTVETFFEFAEKYYNYKKETFLHLPNESFSAVIVDLEEKIEERIEELLWSSKDMQKAMDTMQEASEYGANFDTAATIAQETAGKKVDIKETVERANDAIQQGITGENAVKVATILGKNIIDIINQYSGKQYKSLDDVSFEELKGVIRQIAKDFMPSKDDDLKTSLEKNDTFKYLFKCVASQSDKDIEKIYGAFKAVVTEYSAKFKSLFETIDNLKTKSKEELKALLTDGTAQKMLEQFGITGKQADSIIDMLTKLFNDENLSTDDIFSKLNSEFNLDKIKSNNKPELLFSTIDSLKTKSPKELKQLIKDGTITRILIQSKVPEDQRRDIIANLSKILDNQGLLETKNSNIGEKIFRALVDSCEWDNIIAKINEKSEADRTDDDNYYLKIDEIKRKIRNGDTDISGEELELYKAYTDNTTSLGNSIAASLIQHNQKLADLAKQEYGERFDDMMHELAIYVNKNPEIKVDFTYLDSLTDGKFSSYVEEYVASINNSDSASSASNESLVSGDGYGYTTTSGSSYTSALNNVSYLTSQLYSDEDNTYTVEKSTNSSDKPKQQAVSQQAAVRSSRLFDKAWKDGKIDIKYLAQNFNDACSKGVQKVWNFLDRNQQNRMEYLNAWRNTELSTESAERYDMDKDEIAQLELSIGQTKVLQNRYNQLHKNEADKPDKA